MKDEELINQYKKEFSDDISLINISCEALRKVKISDDVLSAEVGLRNVFGDEVYSKDTDESVDGKKEIVKLDENAIAADGQVRELCENIADNEFDENLNTILVKTSGEENQ